MGTALVIVAITACFGWASMKWAGPNVTVIYFIVATSHEAILPNFESGTPDHG